MDEAQSGKRFLDTFAYEFHQQGVSLELQAQMEQWIDFEVAQAQVETQERLKRLLTHKETLKLNTEQQDLLKVRRRSKGESALVLVVLLVAGNALALLFSFLRIP